MCSGVSQCHSTKALSLKATVPWHPVSIPQHQGTQSQFHSSKVSMPQYQGTQSQFHSSKVSVPQYQGTQSQCHSTKALSLKATVPWHPVSKPQYHGTQSQFHSSKVSMPQHQGTQSEHHCTMALSQCHSTIALSLNVIVLRHPGSMLWYKHTQC